MENVGDLLLIGEKWKAEPATNKIYGKSHTVQVEPKVMALLLYLYENKKRVVSKEELVREVWEDQHITENTVSQAISKLRKVLEDDPSQPQYIETIPKKGYRLIAEASTASSHVGPTPSESKARGFLLAKYQDLFTGSVPLGIGVLAVVIILLTLFSLSLFNQDSTVIILDSTPVTSLQGVESDPAVSPGGGKLAYAWKNPQTGLQNIFVKVIADPSSDLQLTESNGQDSSPSWSPDGNRIAFIRHTVDRCWIYTISSVGGRPEKLVSCGENNYADLNWSPDGKWLAYNDRTQAGNFGIVLVKAESGEKRILTQPDATYWGDYSPKFSPDGSKVAFTRAFSEGVQDLFVIETVGNRPERITHEYRNIFGLTWHKNSDEILFSSNRSGTYDLWSVSLTTKNVEAVHKGERDIVNPDINADNRVVYESRFYDMNIWNYTFPDSTKRTKTSSPFIHSTRWELYPTLSKDGNLLAFITDRSGHYELWVSNADGTEAGQLTHFSGPFVSSPDWSPDNTRLVFDTRSGGQGDIYRIDADGGRPMPLVTDSSNDLVPRWSNDGKWVYFASDRSGQWQVWRITADGKNVEQVTIEGGFAARTLPDNENLYFSKLNKKGIWVKSPDGKTTLIVENLDPGDWGNWQLTQKGIYYVDRSKNGFPVISFKEFSTGENKTIFEPAHVIPTHDAAFTISKDGNRILLGRRERRESDLLQIQLPS